MTEINEGENWGDWFLTEPGYKKRKTIVTEKNIKKISSSNYNLWQEFERDMYVSKGENCKQTLGAYKSAILAFMIFLADNHDNIDFLKVDHKIVKNFLFYCQTELGNNGKIRNLKTSAISSLFNYCAREEYIIVNPLLNKLKRADVTNEQIIDQPYPNEYEINLMREAIDKIQRYEKRMMMKLFLELAISTASRVGAIVQFSEDNLDLKNRVFLDIREKRGKITDCSFSVRAHNVLEEWIEYKRKNNINISAIFFYKEKNKIDNTYIYHPMVKSGLQKMSKRIGMLVGINTHAHSFRKAFSTIAKNEKNVDIAIIQEKLLHESSDTTMKFYIKKDNKKVQEVLDKIEF
jgi:integrase